MVNKANHFGMNNPSVRSKSVLLVALYAIVATIIQQLDQNNLKWLDMDKTEFYNYKRVDAKLL